MTKMPEMIPTSFEPGVLASVIPVGLRHVNAYLSRWRNRRDQLRESQQMIRGMALVKLWWARVCVCVLFYYPPGPKE